MRRPQSLRVPATVITAIVAVLALAGCGAAPSRTDAAAVVGSQVIGIDQLQQQLRVVAPQVRIALDEQAGQTGRPPGEPIPPDVLASQSRRLLTVSIFHDLIGEQARRDGLTAGPQQVAAAVAALGGPQAAASSGYDPATFQQVVTDQVLAAQIGRRYFDGLAVTVDLATVQNKAAADALAARVAAAPSQTSALFAGLPAGTSSVGQTLRPGGGSSGGTQASPSSLVFGLPAGTVAVVFPPSQSQDDTSDPANQPWTVIHVAQRTLTAPPAPGLTPGSSVDDRTMTEVGLRLIQPLALELGVTVNPRYGTWDPSQLSIVSSPAAAGSVQPAAAAP